MAATFSNLLVHVVFTTKHREPNITAALRPDLEKYIGCILRNEGHDLLAIGGLPDHIHLLVKFRADASVSDIVRLVKANSSKWSKERVANFAWQSGFGSFSFSESQRETIRSYINNQQEHHRKVSFQEEYLAFLRRHGIEPDDRYVWG